MQPAKKSRKKTWIVLLSILLIGIGGWLYFGGQLDTLLNKQTLAATNIEEPSLDTELIQTTLITPEEGGTVRTTDKSGVVVTLEVPKGAVKTATEVAIAPLVPDTSVLTHGVLVTPLDISFLVPARLSFNDRLTETIGGTKVSLTDAHVLTYQPDTKTLEMTANNDSLATDSYLPVVITDGGWYGVSEDMQVVTAAAAVTLESLPSVLAVLEAGIVLTATGDLKRSFKKDLRLLAREITEEKVPDLYELALSVELLESLGTPIALIPTASAYGLYDGYLQFRCNYEETTYEEAILAMTIAQRLGYDDVAKTCRTAAELLSVERAEAVDKDKSRPVIDAIEVLQQMQLLGVDDTPGGKKLADSLADDIDATIEDKLAKQGQPRTNKTGTVRGRGPSNDKLLGHDTTLIEELVGVTVLPALGINAFDEESWKQFGARTHAQVSGLIEVTSAMCDMMKQPPFNMFPAPPELNKECQKVQSSTMKEGLNTWKEEVDEYAEGVSDIQSGTTPDDAWKDTSRLDPFLEWLEQ